VRKALPGADSIVEDFNTEIKHMLADGTYNEILQLSWIRADVDGDGRLELVPKNAQAGKIPPTAGYEILSLESTDQTAHEGERFWIDGRAYEGWEAVPKKYKKPNEGSKEATRTTDLPFKFTF
jgi:hypothetical protein